MLAASPSLLLVLSVEAASALDVDGLSLAVSVAVVVVMFLALAVSAGFDLDDLVLLSSLGGSAIGDVVGAIVGDEGFLAADLQAAVHGFEQAPNGVASAGDLDLDPLVVALAVHDGEGPAGFGVDVLGDVAGVGVTPVTQRATGQVDGVGVGASGAMARMGGEVGHDRVLLVASRSTDRCGGSEVHLAHEGRHLGGGDGAGWSDVFVVRLCGLCRIMRNGRIVIISGGVDGRQRDGCARVTGGGRWGQPDDCGEMLCKTADR